MTDSKKAVRERLLYFETKLRDLAAKVGSKISFSTEEKKARRQEFKQIKEELALERKRLREKERREELDPWEKLLSRQLHQAAAALHSRWDSNPSTWVSELHSAASDCALGLDRVPTGKG